MEQRGQSSVCCTPWRNAPKTPILDRTVGAFQTANVVARLVAPALAGFRVESKLAKKGFDIELVVRAYDEGMKIGANTS